MIKRSLRRTCGVASALTLAIAACGGSPLGPDPTDAEFDASLGIDLAAMTETASGLFVLDVVVGTGAIAAAGDTATVAYEVWLADATPIDSGPGFKFLVGGGAVIAGFDEGVTGMRVGGERTIVIPASLGYGSDGYSTVPGDAVLVYDLSLTAVLKPPF